jgi:CBS domain-containing protein
VSPAKDLRPLLVRLTAQIMDHVSSSTERDAATDVTDETRGVEPSDTVRMFVSDDLICIAPDATLRQIAQRLAAEGVGALVVTDGDRTVGIISERDVVRAVASGRDLDTITAAELGTRRLITCRPDTTVQAAAALMMEYYVRHLLVEDRNGLVGMVSARDLLGAYAS